MDKVRFAEMRRNMAVIIDGKKVSQEIKDEVKEKVAALKEKYGSYY